MIAKVWTSTPLGYNASLVEIETDVANGLPATIIVGLPDTVVQESKERVRAALKSSGFDYPIARVSISLAPGNLPKIGSHFDLGIAISILIAAGLLKTDVSSCIFIGELALDGRIRGAKGVLSMIISAKKAGISTAVVPKENAQEAVMVDGVEIIAVLNLAEVINHLLKVQLIAQTTRVFPKKINNGLEQNDFAFITGQLLAKRALEIAAAGGHNVLMSGPPGSGKTMLAKAFPTILPALSSEEQIEVANLYSLAGLWNEQHNFLARPFRNPHHSSSVVALVGGGGKPKPGEISLAHKGALFLDEFPEFPRQIIEALRQPLEEKRVVISRSSQTITFPADFILIAAKNPCPCGNYGEVDLSCKCHPLEIKKYNNKLSGPILDRIDLHLNVPRLKYQEFKVESLSESSIFILDRVNKARKIQYERNKNGITNSLLSTADVRKYCQLNPSSEKLLAQSADKYKFSGRAINRLLKVARTIADLAASTEIEESHLQESLQYRGTGQY